MTPVTIICGRAYPFGLANIDTDAIISAEWLKTISRTGLGKGAFEAARRGPGNIFDDPVYAGAPILIAGENFGCGSSREHAAWALWDMGIKAIIAPSFSDIFASNAFKNGVLTVVLPQDVIDRLMDVAKTDELSIDLECQTVTTQCQETYEFEIDLFRKHCLTHGLDEIGLTLEQDNAIIKYESRARTLYSWAIID